MSVDHDYCFMDEEVADSCSGSVKPLRPGDTVLYAVQPKFRNVDIKIIIDVTEGSLDVYLSAEAQMFLVKYNQTTGYNSVNFDKKYPIKIHKETDEPEYKLEYRSRVWSPTENYFSRYSGYIPIQVHFDIGRIHSDTNDY
ncbi:multiple epidermal growth factor-like domains protein 8 [Eurytemora carolleeae]|uniref:multiple epidermal growth factor-like domains protein 8 n=1 Tax=Eurytemora carolleeae TaxID=1294199 RepID=UPI000C7869B9|nr:multiple epidermal growth factor-like domains protein 8 [Eurytemora carolleeae]|eukprot:XP_023342634.1 multiple epidermal growth factor-like domains protein 8 [Eurytemora affinis]